MERDHWMSSPLTHTLSALMADTGIVPTAYPLIRG
jgi:hypothetical protein